MVPPPYLKAFLQFDIFSFATFARATRLAPLRLTSNLIQFVLFRSNERTFFKHSHSLLSARTPVNTHARKINFLNFVERKEGGKMRAGSEAARLESFFKYRS